MRRKRSNRKLRCKQKQDNKIERRERRKRQVWYYNGR